MIYCVIRINDSLICYPIVFKIYNQWRLRYKLLIFINTFAAKPLKKPISQCQACFIDLIIIYLFYYLPINYFFKISACYISLERDFIAEYYAINLIKLLSLNR